MKSVCFPTDRKLNSNLTNKLRYDANATSKNSYKSESDQILPLSYRFDLQMAQLNLENANLKRLMAKIQTDLTMLLSQPEVPGNTEEMMQEQLSQQILLHEKVDNSGVIQKEIVQKVSNMLEIEQNRKPEILVVPKTPEPLPSPPKSGIEIIAEFIV